MLLTVITSIKVKGFESVDGCRSKEKYSPIKGCVFYKSRILSTPRLTYYNKLNSYVHHYMCSIIYKLNSVKKTFNSKVLLFEKLPLKAKTSYKLNKEFEPLKFHFP